MIKVCVVCHRSFNADESWKTKCISCWKRQNNIDGVSVKEQIEDAFSEGYTAGYAAGRGTGSGDWVSRELDALIRLCHPDRHGNSEASNRITKILLGMRK